MLAALIAYGSAYVVLSSPPRRSIISTCMSADAVDTAADEDQIVSFSDKAFAQLMTMRDGQGLEELHIR